MNFTKLMTGIDVNPLLRQIAENTRLWKEEDEWARGKGDDCAVTGVKTIFLRYPRPTPPAMQKAYDLLPFHVLYAAQKLVFDLMRVIPGEHLGKVIITRLERGVSIKGHIDYTPYIDPSKPECGRLPPYYLRYHIPLVSEPGAWFWCGTEKVHMVPGEAWGFDNQLIHGVDNFSDSDRIHLLMDIRPFGVKIPHRW